jgi:3-methyladenine DNA glycosylase AlkD
MHNYIRPLVKLFRQNANAANAKPMAKYMKNLFPYLGIKTPQRRELLKQFYKEYGKPEISELKPIIIELWEQPEREFQYCAVSMLQLHKNEVDASFIELYEQLIITKSWWDTVDGIAANLVGNLFKKYPEMIKPHTEKWQSSGNMWLQRTALLFQLNYKAETNVELMFDLIRRNLCSKEFFINKAIGWILRQYSKTDAQVVIDFVKKTDLASLSKREALKWLNNHSAM